MSTVDWLKENKWWLVGGAVLVGGAFVATQRDRGANVDPGSDYTPSGEPKKLLSKDSVNTDPFSGQPCKPGVGDCNPSTDLASLKALFKAERAKIRDLKKRGASESELKKAWRRLNFIGIRYIWARHKKAGLPKYYAVSGLGQFDFSLPDFSDQGDYGTDDMDPMTEFEYGGSPNGYDVDDQYYIVKTGDTGVELFESEIPGITNAGSPGEESESWGATTSWDGVDVAPTVPSFPDYPGGASDSAYQDAGFPDDPYQSGDYGDFDDGMMGYTLGAGASPSYTGADVIRSAQALIKSGWKGKNCWEWVREVYRRAGNTGSISQNQFLFAGSQYRYKWRNRDNKRTKNPWVKMHNVPFLPDSLYGELKPGDWLYIFNKSSGPNGGHSFIFTGWEDEGKRIAKGYGNTGANKPGRIQKFDFTKHPVTHWMRPPGTDAPSSLTLGRWFSEFYVQQPEYWVRRLQHYPKPRQLAGYGDQYDFLPQENGWVHTAPGTLAMGQRPMRHPRKLQLHGMNIKW